MNKPGLYIRVNHLQRRDANDYSMEFAKEIGKMSGRCLDIGSGPGDVMIDMILPKLDPNATLVCSDISGNMVNFGGKKYENNKRVSFIKLNIESQDLPKEMLQQFDHVTSFYCINWCQDFCQVFENIFNLLQPGGAALLAIVAKAPALHAYTNLAVVPRYQPYMKDARRKIPVYQNAEPSRETLNSLEALIEDVGFEIHHSSLREKTWTFDTPDALLGFMLALDPFIDRMPTDVKEEYKKDLVAEAARNNIIFNKNDENENEYSVLFTYYAFVLYLNKPLPK